MSVDMSPSPPSRTMVRSRREVLATSSVLAVPLLSGCSDFTFPTGSEGEGETIEIMVENRTDEPAVIAVRIEADDGAMLFSQVYELEPGHLDSAGGIETIPETVSVFTPEGVSATWEYSPDLEMECDGEDIGITLRSDGSIDSWYAC